MSYVPSGAPGTRAPGASAAIRAEFLLIAAALTAQEANGRFGTLGVGTASNPIFYTASIYAGGVVSNYLQIASGASGLGLGKGTLLGLNAANLGELYVETGLATYVNTVELMRVNAAGVGVGVVPTVKLQVGAVGDVAATVLKVSNAGSSTVLTHDVNNANFGTDANGKGLVFQTNGSAKWGVSPGGTLYPITHNLYQIGSTGLRPSGIYGAVGDFSGAVGINGKTPVAAVAAAAISTDLATVITLANGIRTALINFGIFI